MSEQIERDIEAILGAASDADVLYVIRRFIIHRFPDAPLAR